ncbi:MAG: DUF6263 family protein [Flavobacteriaceae bacterium]|nr:DUF6263 family protein [Flavobacteriaceae bacterium]
MNKIILASALVLSIMACKKDEKPAIVGTNNEGKELVINAEGDTVIYEAPPREEAEIIKEKENLDGIKAANDGSYKFGLNLKKGSTYPFKIFTKSTSTESDGKQSATMTQESTTTLEYMVKEVKDSTFVLDVTYKQFAEKYSDGKESFSFDTNSPTAPTNEFLKLRYDFNKAVVGNTFQMEVSTRGKVKSINNLWNVREKVKNKLKDNLSPEEIKALDEIINMAINDEAMQHMFEESMAYYPKKDVKLGDTWNRTESAGSANSKMTYTFESIENNIATIKLSGTSTGSETKNMPDGSGMKLHQSLDGKVNGTVNINVNSGWIQNAVMDKDETMRMTQEFQGQKANYSSKVKSNTKIN